MSIYINKIKRKTIKCEICAGDLLDTINDIKSSDERYEVLLEFCQKLETITKTKTTIEMLKNWRKMKL